MTGRFRIELLDGHDRASFNCGNERLNSYFKQGVGQDMRRHVTLCYVAVEHDTGKVAGFYTLAASSVVLDSLPAEVLKRLPRYPTVPVVRIGRLAIDQAFQGQRLGGVLLFDAINRITRSGIAAFAVVVDAKDESAAAFYKHHGFQQFEQQPLTLFLPIGTSNSH